MAAATPEDNQTEDQSAKDSTTDFITNNNGQRLFCKYWSKHLKSPRALLCIVHGAAEHCLSYGSLAEILQDEGFYVFSHDHQGHGQSEGTRMDITDFKHYVRDLFQHIDKVKKDFPDLPVFLLGHSMGGAISILAGLERPEFFAGIVLISPAVTPEQDTVGPVKIFFAKIVAKVAPQLPLLWMKDSDMTRNTAVVQKIKDDPLNYHGGMKVRWGMAMLAGIQEIEKKLPTIKWPFLCLHGSDDRIVNSKGSESLYKMAASQDKTLKIYPDCFHQLHLEIEPVASEVINEIKDWLVNRVK